MRRLLILGAAVLALLRKNSLELKSVEKLPLSVRAPLTYELAAL